MKVSLKNLPFYLLESYDVFIASASYEERSLSVAASVIDKIKFTDRLVAHSAHQQDIINRSLNYFSDNGFTTIQISIKDQVYTANCFIDYFKKILLHNPNVSFLIDITTFTRQTLLILLRILRNYMTSNNLVQFLYTCANEYAVGLPEHEKWLSKGILEVNSVYGYLGIIKPSRPYHLTILMGYEVERAASLINAYEPTLITVGYAKEHGSVSRKHYLMNKKRINELLLEYPNAQSFEFCLTDIEESKIDIVNYISQFKMYNNIVSPMNNKISTLACGLAAFEDESIQLSIALPAIYNYTNYSTPGVECYVLEVPDLIK